MNLHDLPLEAEDVPNSQESEHGVLASLLIDNEAFDRVADLVQSGDFYDERNSAIFAAIASLVMSGKHADVITTLGQMQAMGLVGVTLPELARIEQAAMNARNARQYAQVVAEHALARRLQAATNEARTIALDAAIPVTERVGQAQGILEAVAARKAASQPRPIYDFVADMLDRVQALADGTVQPGIPTRIPTLDKMLGGGIKPKKLMVIAARPSVGKSSIAEQICLNLALDGHGAAMLSMEMTGKEMTDRAACNLGRVNLDHLETGKLDDEEWGRLSEAVERMRDLPLYFDFQSAMTLQDIAAKARMLKRRSNIVLLVVDYLQLCASAKPKESRHHQIEEISRGLKNLAGQLDITIIELSQFSREVEKRASGRPILADLKESGAIEEDADVVALMWRHARGQDADTIGIDLAKNRQGRIGELAMRFEGRYQRWDESTEPLHQPQQSRAKTSRYSEDF